MTAFQRILINTERWNETVVTPSLTKPHELICTPNSKKIRQKIQREKYNKFNHDYCTTRPYLTRDFILLHVNFLPKSALVSFELSYMPADDANVSCFLYLIIKQL